MKNQIDVLIPVYNAEKYIGKCLDSLINQTYKDLRIVVVNDGSKDGTKTILDEYQNNYKNIVVFDKQNEGSISKTRNYLLSKIESDYFTFFDSDDYAEPNYIEVLYNLLVLNDADVSLCGKVRHSEYKTVNVKRLNKKLSTLKFDRQNALAEMISSKLFNGTVYCKLFKTKCLKNASFDDKIHYGEDLDFCFKIMQNCDKFIYTTEKLYHYIVRKNSIVTSRFNTKKLTCLDCYEKIIENVKDNEELSVCAKSMHGLIAIELLYYVVRDHYKDKALKKDLKLKIKKAMPYVKKNKRLPLINRLSPLIFWLTQIL